jgi:hypothetical protein
LVSAGLPARHHLLPDADPIGQFPLRQPGEQPYGPEALPEGRSCIRGDDWQANDLRQPGAEPRPGLVSALLPGSHGAGIDTKHVRKSFHAESLSLAEVADRLTQIGRFRGLAGVISEESDHCRQCPEVRGGGSGLPVEDGGLVDPDPQRNLPLEESEVQTALSDVIAD